MFQIKNRLDPGRSPFSPDWESMGLGKTLGKTLLDGEWSSAVSLGGGGGGAVGIRWKYCMQPQPSLALPWILTSFHKTSP